MSPINKLYYICNQESTNKALRNFYFYLAESAETVGEQDDNLVKLFIMKLHYLEVL